MKTLSYALAVVALGVSATAALAESDGNGFNSSFVRNTAPGATVVEGRQSVRVETTRPSLNEADALRLKIATDRDANSRR